MTRFEALRKIGMVQEGNTLKTFCEKFSYDFCPKQFSTKPWKCRAITCTKCWVKFLSEEVKI